MPDSRLPRPRSDSHAHEYTCAACGTKYLAASHGCPSCASKSGTRSDDELTKKVIDDNDLKKGW